MSEEASEATGRRVGPAAVAALAWIAVATVLQLLRQPGAPAVDTVWAEDGAIWLSDVLVHGQWGAATDVYAGYYHLLPRILAVPMPLLPLEWAAPAFAIAAAVIVSTLSVFVYVQSSALFRSWPARATLALLVVIPPPGGWETTANVTNLQWNLLYPCCWALIVSPPSTRRTIAAAAVAGITALTAPVSVVFVPLAVWAVVRWPRPASLAVGGGFLVATAVQVAVSLAQGTPEPVETHLADLPPLYALRVGAGAVLGDRALIDLWPAWGWGLAALGGVVVVLAAAAVAVDPRRRVPMLTMLAASAAAFAVPVYLRGTILITPDAALVPNGAKWVLGPMLLLATLLVAAAEGPPATPRWVRWPVVTIVAAALGFTVVSSYRLPSDRAKGPRWSASISVAEARCRSQAIPTVEVPITPKGFFATIPCSHVLGS